MGWFRRGDSTEEVVLSDRARSDWKRNAAELGQAWVVTRALEVFYPETAAEAARYVLKGGDIPVEPPVLGFYEWHGVDRSLLNTALPLIAERGSGPLVRYGELLRVTGYTPRHGVPWLAGLDEQTELSRIQFGYIEQAMIDMGGKSVDAVVIGLTSTRWLQSMDGFIDALLRHRTEVREWWSTAPRGLQRSTIVKAKSLPDEGLAVLADLIAHALVSFSQAERVNDQEFLTRLLPVRDEVWRRLATYGTARERRGAMSLLWSHGDPDAKEWAIRAASEDTVSSIRDLSALWDPDRAVPVSGADAITAQAKASLPRGLSKGLRWLTDAGLPPLHWLDGSLVDDIVWQAWAQHTVKTKTPRPNAALRALATELDPASRAEFALALLEAWIAQDLKPRSADVASELAEQLASERYQRHLANPRMASVDPLYGKSQAEILSATRVAILREPVGSAASTRGLVALVAAFGGTGITGPVKRYLASWSERTLQAKALIAMLAYVDDAAAIQSLVSLPHQLRRSGLAKGARVSIAELAERLGLTIAELGDRAVPDAGLDDRGELHLSYGGRTFTAVLSDDLSWIVRDEDGAIRRALPPARSTDDAAAVQSAKAAFSDAKSTVKDVMKIQVPRLRNHMAAQTVWTFPDWTDRIARHPVMSRLGRRLVWSAEPGGLFRPLDDGTLTGVDDQPVEIDPAATIRLAHSSALSHEDRVAWSTHLQDYEVPILFDQFGHDLPDSLNPASVELADRQGWIVNSFTLRAQAMNRGYRRHDSESEGFFASYVKDLADVTVLIGFTGSYLPEQSRSVALTGLQFQRGEALLPLGDVPLSIVTEAWADLVAIAAAGTGYDPQWQITSKH